MSHVGPMLVTSPIRIIQEKLSTLDTNWTIITQQLVVETISDEEKKRRVKYPIKVS